MIGRRTRSLSLPSLITTERKPASDWEIFQQPPHALSRRLCPFSYNLESGLGAAAPLALLIVLTEQRGVALNNRIDARMDAESQRCNSFARSAIARARQKTPMRSSSRQEWVKLRRTQC